MNKDYLFSILLIFDVNKYYEYQIDLVASSNELLGDVRKQLRLPSVLHLRTLKAWGLNLVSRRDGRSKGVFVKTNDGGSNERKEAEVKLGTNFILGMRKEDAILEFELHWKTEAMIMSQFWFL